MSVEEEPQNPLAVSDRILNRVKLTFLALLDKKQLSLEKPTDLRTVAFCTPETNGLSITWSSEDGGLRSIYTSLAIDDTPFYLPIKIRAYKKTGEELNYDIAELVANITYPFESHEIRKALKEAFMKLHG